MSNTVAQIIDEAAIAIGLIQPGVTLSSSIQADFFRKLNQMWLSWGSEEATSNVWYSQSLSVTAGTSAYTVGTGGTLVTTANPVRIVSWQSISGNFKNGGKVIPFEELDAIAKDGMGSSAVIAQAVGADNAYGPTNLKIFPTPAVTPGALVLDYYAPMAAFATVNDALSLAPWFERAIWLNLAIEVYPTYQRPGFDITVLAGLAQQAKATIVARNTAAKAQAA